MVAQKIGILTTTFYATPSNLRFKLACQTIKNAKEAGHRALVVDGSPDGLVSKAFYNVEDVFVYRQKTHGMGNSRRELFGYAMEGGRWGYDTAAPLGPPDVLLWTEPEKEDVVFYLPRLRAPIIAGEADIVIPRRTEKSFGSYPVLQVETEKAANAVFAEVTGLNLDMMFGPVMFRKSLLPIFAACDPTKYGAADTYIQQIAVMEAIKQGHRVVSVPIDFFYPAAQRHEEETVLAAVMVTKRQRQFDDLASGFRVVAKALELVPRIG